MFDALGPRVQEGTHTVGAVALPSISGLAPDVGRNLRPGTVPALVAIGGITALLMWRNPEHLLEYGALGTAGVALVFYRNMQT